MTFASKQQGRESYETTGDWTWFVQLGWASDILERFSANLAFVRYKLREHNQLSLHFVFSSTAALEKCLHTLCKSHRIGELIGLVKVFYLLPESQVLVSSKGFADICYKTSNEMLPIPRSTFGSLSSPGCRNTNLVISSVPSWNNLSLWSTRVFLYDSD